MNLIQRFYHNPRPVVAVPVVLLSEAFVFAGNCLGWLAVAIGTGVREANSCTWYHNDDEDK